MRKAICLGLTILAAGCASTAPVSMEEPRRVVGTENAVRIDAQIFGERLGSATNIPLKYDITNNRPQPIAIADIIPETSYDPDTQTVTVSIGSEVPGEQLLPRLIAIAPGEKKSFSTVARVNLMMSTQVTPYTRYPNAMRLKVNFLDDTAHFQKLIDIPERAVHDPALAEELFSKWLERNETLYTNSVPMRWSTEPPAEAAPPPIGRRRRRG
jgi:hypothetical protein